MIYIDPPYNTKSENFVYNDNFKKSNEELIEEFGLEEDTTNFLQNVYGTRSHSGWLAFMYPRLKIARDLLKDDGVIFISIDDNEQANLKIMCDEIFGEDNFIGTLKWRKNNLVMKGSNIKSVIENIMLFSKNKNKCRLKYKMKEAVASNFSMISKGYGNKDVEFIKGSVQFSIDDGEYKKGKYGSLEVLEDFFVLNGLNKSVLKIRGEFKWSNKKITEKLENGAEVIIKNKETLSPRIHFFGDESTTLDYLDSERYEVETNEEAKSSLKQLFKNEDVFDYPKPTSLIKHFLNISNTENDIILDFFAGSGTTAHAVMQLNAEDGGNRKFILAQLDEPIDPKKSKTAYDFCLSNNFKSVISSICIERVNRAGEKIKQELIEKKDLLSKDKELDIGYKVFSLTEKPKIEYNTKQKTFNIEHKRKTTLDILYNMMMLTGKELHLSIEEIKKDTIYKIGKEIYILGNITMEELEKYKDSQVYLDAFADIDLEKYLNLNVKNKDNLRIIY